MKKTTTALATICALAVGSLALQAQTYYDSADFAQAPSGTGNLYQTNGAPMLADLTDGTTQWRYRYSGSPSAICWNLNSYQISYADGDIPGYQHITGLNPDSQYFVSIYGDYPYGSSARRGVDISLDGGMTYSLIDNQGAQSASQIHWVDNSTALGAAVTPTSGDTRFWSPVPGIATADASGNFNIYIKLPATLTGGVANDRFILDGFAVTAVPEPGTFALAGMGLLALLMIRRRR